MQALISERNPFKTFPVWDANVKVFAWTELIACFFLIVHKIIQTCAFQKKNVSDTGCVMSDLLTKNIYKF